MMNMKFLVDNIWKALESYKNTYRICPMRDLEEQIAWLMGEVGDEEKNYMRGI